MALHTDLPIYRTGAELLGLAVSVQEQMPRGMKRLLGEKIVVHCVDMLDLMALANATKHETRAGYIEQLLARHRAVTVLLRVAAHYGVDAKADGGKSVAATVEPEEAAAAA